MYDEQGQAFSAMPWRSRARFQTERTFGPARAWRTSDLAMLAAQACSKRQDLLAVKNQGGHSTSKIKGDTALRANQPYRYAGVGTRSREIKGDTRSRGTQHFGLISHTATRELVVRGGYGRTNH